MSGRLTIEEAFAPAARVTITPGDGTAFDVTAPDVARLATLIYAVEVVLSDWGNHRDIDFIRLLDAYLDLIYRGDPTLGEAKETQP